MATQVRVPTGTGGQAQWTPSAGNDYDCVTDKSDLTYISKTSSYQNHRFTFAAFAIDSSAITKLSTTIRVKDGGGTACTVRHHLRINGGSDFAGNYATTASWVDDTHDWLTNPDTGSGWLEADIEGTGSNPLQEIGIGAVTITEDTAYCSDLYTTVDYTAAAAGLSIPVARRRGR